MFILYRRLDRELVSGRRNEAVLYSTIHVAAGKACGVRCQTVRDIIEGDVTRELDLHNNLEMPSALKR